MKPLRSKHYSIAAFAGIVISAMTFTGCAYQPQYPGHNPSYPTPQYPNVVVNERGVPSHYQVRQGDTIGTIARYYGLDYRQIASLNNLDSNYTIYTDQWLKLWDRGTPTNPGSGYVTGSYQYPTTNPILRNFNSATGIPGMWFGGNLGDPILASMHGTVLYAGNGLPEYGNLVMIRHDDNNVTAYAHNQQILVSEGDRVRTGQRIATMGSTGLTNQVALEFQFRKDGNAIDPRIMLNR